MDNSKEAKARRIAARVKAEKDKKAAKAAKTKTAPKKEKAVDPEAAAKAEAKAKAKADADAEKARAAAEAKAAEEKTLRSLAPVAKEINVRLQKAKELDGKSDDHRLGAALRLAEAKKICEEAKVNFKKWAEENVADQSFETIRKLAVVGAAENPTLALADMRGKNAAANKAHREKKAAKGAAPEGRALGPKETPFKRADEALLALPDRSRVELLKSHAKKEGLAVVSETKLAEIESGAVAADVDALQAAFQSLKPSDQMRFLSWAASEVGMRVSSALETAASGDQMPEIPAFLKRGKKAA